MATNQDNDSPAESRGDNITRITNIYGGNYNENIEGDYYQNRKVILKRDFIACSPYKGLKKFDADDKDLFFGRDKLVQKLIQAVDQSNVVLVLGASGSGKSSVVRAGVIPKLKIFPPIGYQSCLFTPDRNPFESFHSSLGNKYEISHSEIEFVKQGTKKTINQASNLLKSKHSQWLIFIDQFEELFTICANAETRQNFIQGIVDLSQDQDQSVKLILAMRSDFLEELGAYPEFSELAEKNINLVADMQTEELHQAIEKPAAKHGVVFEPSLVEEIIRDVQGQAGSLPLLQYTLDLLWQESDLSERTLKSETYHQLDGVSGALQKHVNQIYQDLSPEQQLATKQILLRLVDVVALEKSEVLRTAVSRRAYKSEFTDTQAATVQLLVDQNLLVSDELKQEGQATVEIAHEALLTSWAELKDWISDARNTISLNNRLAEDAARWQGLKGENQEQANEELWTGSKLEKAIEFRKDGTFDVVLGGLSESVNDFLDTSIEWREQKIQKELATASKIAESDRKARIEAEKREKAQKKANNKLRIWSLVAVSFGVAASLLGISSYFNGQEAQLKQQAADIKVKLSVDNKIEHLLESIDLVGKNKKSFKSLSELLPEVQSVLYQAVEDSREKYRFNAHQKKVFSVDLSSDGKYLVSSSYDRTVKLWNIENLSLVHTFKGHESLIYSVKFSPDGNYIVSGSYDKTLKLWDIENLSLVHTFYGHQHSVFSVDFSPDGNYIVSGSNDKTLKLWGIENLSLIHTFKSYQNTVWSVEFSPDGKYVVSGGENGTVNLWNIKNRSLDNRFKMDKKAVLAVKFSPDGKYIVSGGENKVLNLWDIENQYLVHTFHTDQDEVWSTEFSFDGKYLASGGENGTVKLWDIKNQSLVLLHPFNAHQSWVVSVDFSPDDKYIVSSSYDNTVKLWDIENQSLVHSFNSHRGAVISAIFSPDGKYIVSSSNDNTVKLWEIENQSLVNTFNFHQDEVWSVDFSPDGKYIVSGSFDNTVKLWDIENQSLIYTFKGHKEAVRSVRFSPNGKYIVSGSFDNTVKLWSLEDLSLLHSFNAHQDKVMSVEFSPDGKYIVSGSWDKTVKLWSVKNLSLIYVFNAHQSSVFSVNFSDDSNFIVSSSNDNTVNLWNIKNQTLIHTFKGHHAAVRSVNFSHSAKYIASASEDHTVNLWLGIDWQDWLEVGCKRVILHPALASSEIESAPGAANTCLKYGRWSDSEKAQFLVKQGLAIASESGDVVLAKRKFRQADKLDSTNVNLEELEAEANQLATQFK